MTEATFRRDASPSGDALLRTVRLGVRLRFLRRGIAAAVGSFVAALIASSALGSLAAEPTAGLVAAALTVAVAAAAVALVTALTVAQVVPGGASPPDPRRAIDISTLIAQSDPDAPGHPRPRAPQHAALAA